MNARIQPTVVFFQRAIKDPRSPIWTAAQLLAVRGLIAAKFLLAARLLGPEMVGLVGVALLSLAIVESLSDTGMQQAIVQRPSVIDGDEAGAVWTLQAFRGGTLALLLLALSWPIVWFFKVPQAANLVALAAILPLLRNTFNPGLFLLQRDRNFRALAGYDALSATADFAVTVAAIRLGFGASSILLGTIAGDSFRLFQTWKRFRIPLRPNLAWDRIRNLTIFGRWIWGSSVITLALNQFDKILVARFLGVTEFGIYQVASRIAQLVLSDGATALGQYLYPSFAHKHRHSIDEALDFFRIVIRRVIPVICAVAGLVGIFAKPIVGLMLGAQWLGAVPVLRVLVIAMSLGAFIAVLVAYCRGIGKPEIVTKATLIQLLILAPVSVLLIYKFGALGMATATSIAGASTVVFLMGYVRKSSRENGPIPVLITSAVRATASRTALSDEQARLDAILAGLSEWAKTPGVTQLVICDGSGFEFGHHVADLRVKYPGLTIETLAFQNDEEAVRKKGKGYGEGQIIKHALAQSHVLASAEVFAKCTGKLWVENYADCRSAFKGEAAFDYNGRIWPRFLDTRFYIVRREFFVDVLASAYNNVDDEGGVFLEHAYLEAMRSRRLSTYAMCPTPRIAGISGSMGVSYKVRRHKARFRDCRSALVQALGL